MTASDSVMVGCRVVVVVVVRCCETSRGGDIRWVCLEEVTVVVSFDISSFGGYGVAQEIRKCLCN